MRISSTYEVSNYLIFLKTEYSFFALCIGRIFFSPLALQPNSGLGRLSETFRFTSVTRSTTIGRIPWTGDQLVVRHLPLHKHKKHAHTTQTLNIHALSGIRTHGFGVLANEDSLCLRPLVYRDRQVSHVYFG
jgi:hypothetical protein